MFPRAPRFRQEHLSDTPGPNAYDPAEMTAHYRKGLLNQTESRFKANGQEEPFDRSTSAAGPTTQRASSRAEGSTTQARERAKQAADLAKAEERIAILEKQVHSLNNEKGKNAADLRLSRQQVDKLQAQVTKTKNVAARNDGTNARIADLQRKLEQSTSKQKVALDKVEAQCCRLQNENEELGRCKKKADDLLAAAEKQIQSMGLSNATLRRQLIEEQDRTSHGEIELIEVRQKCRAQASIIQDLEKERGDHVRENDQLNAQLAEEEGASIRCKQQRNTLELLARQSTQRERELLGLLHERRQDGKIGEVRAQYLKSQLDTCHSEVYLGLDTIAMLKNALQEEERKNAELADALDINMRQISCFHDESLTEAIPNDDVIEELRILLSASDTLRQASEMEIQDERQRNAGLEEAIADLHDQYLNTLRENASLRQGQRSLDQLRQELESVEEAYDKSLLEVMRAHKGEEEAKREAAQARAESSEHSHRIRQLEQINKRLFHAKMREDAWLQERQELLKRLERAKQLETEYHSLRLHAQLLLSKSTSYEAQVEELNDANTMLASHTNPSQKILYLDRIRRELDEKRNECQILQIQQEALQSENKEMQSRLELFCRVDGSLEERPITTFKRVSRKSTRELPRIGVLTERSPNLSSPFRCPEAKEEASLWKKPFSWSLGGSSPQQRTDIELEGELTLDELMASV